MLKHLREAALVVFTILAIPALIMLPFFLSGFIGLR